jgi:hypothetical protein
LWVLGLSKLLRYDINVIGQVRAFVHVLRGIHLSEY